MGIQADRQLVHETRDTLRTIGTSDELMAVFDALEVTLRSYKEDMDAWSYAEYDGRKHSYEDLAPDLMAALDALRSSLLVSSRT